MDEGEDERWTYFKVEERIKKRYVRTLRYASSASLYSSEIKYQE